MYEFDCGEILIAESKEQKDRLWKMRRLVGEAVKSNSIACRIGICKKNITKNPIRITIKESFLIIFMKKIQNTFIESMISN